MTTEQIQQIRAFNRYYTDQLGLLNSHLLNSPYSLAEARILFELAAHTSIRASDIVNRLGIDKSYLSRILKKLERDGLIHRKTSETDGRVAFLALTPQGEKVFHELDLASNQQIELLTQHLTPREKQRLVDYINLITKILSKS